MKKRLPGRLPVLFALCLSLFLSACTGMILPENGGNENPGVILDTEFPPDTQANPEADAVPETEPEEAVPETEPEEAVPETEPEEAVPLEAVPPAEPEESAPAISEGGVYTTKDDVALYLHTYNHLPGNFITKAEARELGWPGGDLEPYAPGKCIGGDYFGNYEGLLPSGRQYRECDINTLGAKKRGAERLIYSTDLPAGQNLIYYTGNHYESFTLLYGEE